MKATKDVVVSIAYQVKNEDGHLVDESSKTAPLKYLHGYNNLIVGLEKAIEGRKVGESFNITVKPEEAYGQYLDTMVQRVPANVFQGVDELEVGMRFIADTDQGQIPVEITQVDGDEVVVDGNHMLAGQTLTFDVEVLELRDATDEEKAHGHVHQAGGCGGHGDECCGGEHHHSHEAGCCGGEHHHSHEEGCCGGGHCQENANNKKEKEKEGCCGACH